MLMHIDSYSFGKLVIDGKEYNGDVLIVGKKIINWWRKEGHRLQVEDLEKVWNYKSGMLIIGQGASGVMSIDEEVKAKCTEMNIKLIAGYTDKMVEEFNKRINSEKIACGLHLTC
jgi:hypothetical protein